MSKTKLLSLALACLVFIIAVFALRGGEKADVRYYRTNEAAEETAIKENENLYFSKKSRKEMKKIYTSELISLYCDIEAGSIAVYDSASKKFWRSIPENYAGIKTGVVVAEVISDGAIYTLYSQRDSTPEVESGENFVKVIYCFERVLPDKNKVKISLPVVFTLEGGMLSAELDCAEIINENGSVILRSVALLPFFGADRDGEKGDYLFVPDGPGLTVDLSENPKSFEPLHIPVYGGDISENENDKKQSLIGAYGIKKGTAAFIGIIEQGAEFAVIKADKALSKSGLNSVGAHFEITPTWETEDGKLAVSKKSYKDKISISYRFLSSHNADYVGMASAARELLIRNGSLPMTTYGIGGEYPFNLSIIGVGYDKDANQTKILTSYSQTYDILSTLAAKGVNGINLRYRGLFDGGINQRNIVKSELALGKTDELSELTDYAKAQNISIFAEVKMITASQKDGFSKKAIALSGDSTIKSNEMFEAYASEFTAPYKISHINENLLVKLRETDFVGICFEDAGKYLYSDFSMKNGGLSNETTDILKKELSSVSANKKLMIDTGNLYSVKYASSVVNLPSTSFYDKRELCSSVPFVQAVYHGFFDYSLAPINTAKDHETMFLRSVEYGAAPHFEWYYTNLHDQIKEDKYNYNNFINEAQLYYQRMSGSFSDLRDARITEHKKLKKNVYMTEYDGQIKVYVNYSKNAVTVEGVTIEPKSFARVG